MRRDYWPRLSWSPYFVSWSLKNSLETFYSYLKSQALKNASGDKLAFLLRAVTNSLIASCSGELFARSFFCSSFILLISASLAIFLLANLDLNIAWSFTTIFSSLIILKKSWPLPSEEKSSSVYLMAYIFYNASVNPILYCSLISPSLIYLSWLLEIPHFLRYSFARFPEYPLWRDLYISGPSFWSNTSA